MATFSRLPQTVPPPAFDPTAFAGGLSPEQAKLFKSLGRNVKGDYASFAKNAGFGSDLAGGFQKWLKQRAPAPPISGPVSSHGPGSGAPPTAPLPRGIGPGVSPPGMPPPSSIGRGINPPGPGNLPPRSVSPPGMPPPLGGGRISPPGMPPPLAKRPSLRAMKSGSISSMNQAPSLQAIRGY